MSSTLQRMELDGEIKLADFHRLFLTLPPEAEVLWDHCHTSPMGDEIIAQTYHDIVIKDLTGESSNQGDV